MLPEKIWKTESAVRLLLRVFATWSIGILLVASLPHLNMGWSESQTKLAGMVIIALAFHGAALFWINSFLKAENLSWRDTFGFTSPRRGRAVVLAVMAAVLVLPVARALQQLTARLMTSTHLHPEPQQVVREIQKGGMSPLHQVFLAGLALIAAPIVEELLFRGIIYPTVKRAGFPKLALWGTSILFALTHENAPAFLSLVFLAVILTLLYENTGTLLAPILAHSCFNTINFVFLLWDKHFFRAT